ncbi:MAG: Hsp20 family protein [bacterium]|nr:Hsp20 family protein [bacterium]
MNFHKNNPLINNNYTFITPTLIREIGLMKTNIYINNYYYNIEMELPGFIKPNIYIKYYKKFLTIIASNYPTNKYLYQERFYGKIKRTFYIGEIDINQIKTKYYNGILLISFPNNLID